MGIMLEVSSKVTVISFVSEIDPTLQVKCIH